MIKIINKNIKLIKVELPKEFMNVSVTTCNHLVADTNNSANWDTLKFPLPKGKWSVYKYNINETENKKIITLIDNRNLIKRLFNL